ncbi:MAG: ABC transporter ATP-binding protein [Thermoplasmatales archaeon]|nr:ABC transporter ATP-binding protein [Thermoplasmatales archaeon]
MGDIIRAESLVKRFGDFTAVDGIDVNVRRGEIYGFLGPNGAGKTTTIRMLTTISRPTSGNIRIDGMDVRENLHEIRARIGVVHQQNSLDRDITARDNIIYHALLQKVPRKEIAPRLEELSGAVGLTPFLDRNIIELSGGWRRKVMIVCTLMHKPSLLFLDEPTAGLDSQSRHALWNLLRLLNKNGTTIFLTTHYIEEAEELCDRVAIIDGGKIRRLGTPTELCEGIGKITVEYDDEDLLRKFRFFPDRESARAFAADLGQGTLPRVRRTTLEDAFLECTGREVQWDMSKVVL